MSVILGIISLASLGVVVYRAYAAGGETQPGFGFTGIFALIFAVTGIVLSVLALNEKRNYKWFPVVGIVLNALVFVWIGLIMYAGANF